MLNLSKSFWKLLQIVIIFKLGIKVDLQALEMIPKCTEGGKKNKTAPTMLEFF